MQLERIAPSPSLANGKREAAPGSSSSHGPEPGVMNRGLEAWPGSQNKNRS